MSKSIDMAWLKSSHREDAWARFFGMPCMCACMCREDRVIVLFQCAVSGTLASYARNCSLHQSWLHGHASPFSQALQTEDLSTQEMHSTLSESTTAASL